MPISDDATYQSAWNEGMRRVIVRDSALLGYVAVGGTLLYQSQQKQPELGLVILFVTFVLGCTIAHHDFMIANLNGYLRRFASGEKPPTELWHSSRLRHSLTVGLVFYTIPATTIFALYFWMANNIANQVPLGAPLHRFLWYARILAVIGIVALISGRIRHFFALPIKVHIGK